MTKEVKPGELLALGDCEFISVNADSSVILNRSNGKSQVITNDVARALQQCLCFATVGSHAASICNAITPLRGHEHAVEATLIQLAENGILALGSERFDVISTAAEKAKALPRTVAFIITCDRPAALERLLSSLADMSGLTRHEHLIIVDDSRESENVRINSDHIVTFNISSAHTAVHVTPKVQDAIRNRLREELPEHTDAIQMLFDRDISAPHATYGVARNFCLLLSVGRRALLMDDDILGYRLKAPNPSQGMSFAGGVPSELIFFPTVNDVLDHIEADSESALDGIADVLGKPLAEIISSSGKGAASRASLAGAPAVILEQLDGGSPVLLAQCGTLGDPGTQGVGWLRDLSTASVESLRASLKARGNGTLERCAWRGARQTTIAKMGSMSQLTGLDNSHLLPPYFPCFRGEDILFAVMLDFMQPQAAIVEVDWCVAHLPIESREPMDLARDPTSGTGSLGTYARRLGEALDPRAGNDPKQRLAAIVSACRLEATKSDGVLSNEYHVARLKQFATQLTEATAKIQQIDASQRDAWSTFLERSIKEAQSALQSRHSPDMLLGNSDEGGAEAVLATYRTMNEKFADALEAWPHIRAHGTDILASVVLSGIR